MYKNESIFSPLSKKIFFLLLLLFHPFPSAPLLLFSLVSLYIDRLVTQMGKELFHFPLSFCEDDTLFLPSLSVSSSQFFCFCCCCCSLLLILHMRMFEINFLSHTHTNRRKRNKKPPLLYRTYSCYTWRKSECKRKRESVSTLNFTHSRHIAARHSVSESVVLSLFLKYKHYLL